MFLKYNKNRKKDQILIYDYVLEKGLCAAPKAGNNTEIPRSESNPQLSSGSSELPSGSAEISSDTEIPRSESNPQLSSGSSELPSGSAEISSDTEIPRSESNPQLSTGSSELPSGSAEISFVTEIPRSESNPQLPSGSSELPSGSAEISSDTEIPRSESNPQLSSGSSELPSGGAEISSDVHIQSRNWRSVLKQNQNLWERSGKFEGDIILPRTDRNCFYGKSYYWPKKELPYKISSNFTNHENNIIMESLTYLSNETCIKPIPWRDKWGLYFLNRPGHGCSTSVGFLGTQHIINLDARLGCVQFGVVLHEMFHALGMWHEQSTPERDKYIDIIWENIIPGDEHNFVKASRNIGSLGFAYDYDSIMHYSAYAFSANGKRTIESKIKGKGQHMGQRNGLSNIDLYKIKVMYACIVLE